MKKLLCWIITLIGVAYTLWMMMIIMFKNMPDPDTAGRAEYTGWVIGSLIGITLFWLMPIVGISFIAWVWKSNQREEDEAQTFYIERPMPHYEKHDGADGNVVSIRRVSNLSLQRSSRR